jgi:hypothetical protein
MSFECECNKKFEILRSYRIHLRQCSKHIEIRDSILTKEFLNENFCINKLTFEQIVEKLDNRVTASEVEIYLKKFDICTRLCICGEKYIEGISYGSHIGHCKEYKTNRDIVLSKEFLVKNYISNQYPATYIAENILNNSVTQYEVMKYLKKFNILTRTNSENISTQFVQDKMKSTMMNRYNVENCSQSEEIKQKKVDTMLNNFGVEHHLQLVSQQEKQSKTVFNKYYKNNVSQVDEIKESKKETFLDHYGVENIFCDSERMKQYWMDKFGVDNPSKVLEIELKKQDTIFKNYGVHNFGILSPKFPVSKSSQKLFDNIYSKINTEFKQFCFYYNLNKEYYLKIDFNKYIYLDFSIVTNDIKISIEFNGDFWHMNPLKFKSTDVNSVTKQTAQEIWNKDMLRTNKIHSLHFKHLIIWEAEINQNYEQTLNKCLSFIKEHYPQSLIGV